MGASPTLLVVTSTAPTASVSSSNPMCILRHIRRFGPPCLRALHSPSPSGLMPIPSMSRLSGRAPPRKGRLTFSVFWRRHKVLRSATAQFNPTNRSNSRRNSSSAEAICRKVASGSGRSGSRHRLIVAAAHVCPLAVASRPSPDQTRSKAIRVASVLSCTKASSWSCKS